ncbi:hypothetical protein BDD12DRAFT_890920 [Trichophaea hybrida]|nr:hypothetical protein BDD12DRAFT_890920 [Trichophaea hybrida]
MTERLGWKMSQVHTKKKQLDDNNVLLNGYDLHYQYHYRGHNDSAEDSTEPNTEPNAEPNIEPVLEYETIAAQAATAVQNEIMYLSMLHTMKYECTTSIEGLLKKFKLARIQLMAADLQTTPDIFFICVSAALHDPINPLAKGQDGMAFVGPSTWLDEQEPTEVDTYDRLKAKLGVIFAPTINTSTQIINKIQTIKYSPDKPVEEHITEMDKIVGRTRLEKYAYQTLLMERIPLSIAKKLTESDPEWRGLELSDLKK